MTKHDALSKIGVYIFPWGISPPTVDDMLETARHADRLEFGSVQIAWHFNQYGSPFGNDYTFDPLVLAPMICANTKRAQVSLNSIILPLLHPYFWARYFANLDILSGERVIPGVALGWSEDDFRIGLAKVKERGRRFNEALEIYTALCRGDAITEPGQFWDARGLSLEPAPRPDMPLWVGGGEKSIDRAARWATALNPTRLGPEMVQSYRDQLDEAGAQYGRSVELIVTQSCAIVLPSDSKEWQEANVWAPLSNRPKDRDSTGSLIGSPELCAERLNAQFEAGADQILLEFDFHGAAPAGEPVRRQLDRFVEHVLPLL